ncbi:hypothetical protein BGZ51_000452 [Haplosporangium sp. Z 767]|nr:hypothetical protein BGZ51_000452 [Haplosporangium sp. Z 767]KAF9196710.1 hypothetical protein BGZ50_007874 [Haplosporangium sp. Z 11]
MKRSNDYAQSHDAFKKPRVAQGGYNNNNNNNYSGHSGMGGSSADMYGGGYGSNPMMMGGFGQMGGGSQYGSQFGGDPIQSVGPYQSYQNPNFGAPYGNTPFSVPFPPSGNIGGGGIRTVYLGNVPSDVTIEEVLNLVHCGLVENARLLPEKSCAFISFMDPGTAAAFYHEATTRKFTLAGQDIRVGWGKPSQVPAQILQAVQHHGATRNVFLGNVDESFTEQELRADFSQFGTIDTIKILREKNIAFIHFASINSAMKAVANMPNEARYIGHRINYGKDRSAKNTTAAPGGVANPFAFGTPGYPQFGSPMGFNPSFDRFSGGGRMGGMGSMGAGAYNMPMGGMSTHNNRTVYLGGISPDTTCEDLCNNIRGGILNSIRYLPAKHIAFVSFVDTQAANNFYNQAQQNGLVIRNRRLKVGWGQNAHALPQAVTQALAEGATRNVYLGAIDDSFTEDRLREDFSEYGDIELVNILKEKNCGFVNFTNILSAVKAVEGIRSNPAYENIKVNFGKDRCGNSTRMNQWSNSGNGHSNGHSSGHNRDALDGDEGGQGAEGVSGGNDVNDYKGYEDDDEMFA